MESEAEEGNATAMGLASSLHRYDFIAGVFFTAEVLPHLARLSLCFQEERLIMWHEVPGLLDATLKVIDNIKISSLSCSCEWQHLPASYITKAEEEGISISNTNAEGFLTQFCLPYLEALITNN